MTAQAGIVITTRNRESDLRTLLRLLTSHPLWEKYPIWIHDDASDQVSPEYWADLRQHATVMCNPERTGYIVNRNASNQAAPYDLIFSLDDDSCFVDADGPDQAVAYLQANPQVAALAFPLVDSLTPPPAASTTPYPCLTYIGCAHLIRKDVFVRLGGYRSDFVHQGEEPELCARIWAAGYEVHAFPGCRVHHWVSPTARNYQRMGFYGPRNRVWSHILHTPFLLLGVEVLRAIASYSKLSFSTRLPLTHFNGLWAGLKQGIVNWSQRQPLPLRLYWYLSSLPISANQK